MGGINFACLAVWFHLFPYLCRLAAELVPSAVDGWQGEVTEERLTLNACAENNSCKVQPRAGHEGPEGE